MAEPYVGEIRCFGFNFAPRGWAFCDGQLLAVAQNDALFAILGTIYGGDGQSNFALPNLQGRIPMHWGNSPGGLDTQIGEPLGATTVTLTGNQIPQHDHTVFATTIAQGATSEKNAVPNSNSFLGPSAAPNTAYQSAPSAVTVAFSSQAISPTGGSTPHENMQPYLCLNFCIALVGIFPSRN